VGFARFGSERIEVVADLGMIEPGTEVVVTEASAARVAVRPRG
jgi:membrane-bound ClpP family serine protease